MCRNWRRKKRKKGRREAIDGDDGNGKGKKSSGCESLDKPNKQNVGRPYTEELNGDWPRSRGAGKMHRYF